MSPRKKTIGILGILTAAASLAACTGSGSNAIIGGGGGAGNRPSPTPSPTPALTGEMQTATGGNFAAGFAYAPSDDAQIVFSCGCTSQAGTTTTDSTGSFTAVASSTATPAAPHPTYTIVPGRNYIIVASSGSAPDPQTSGPQAWTIEFAGKVPAHNLSLTATSPSDVFAAAVALYVFQISPNGILAFDDWNFNTLEEWYTSLKSTTNGADIKLLNDIAAQSSAGKSLYPSTPTWDSSVKANTTIASDVAAVKAAPGSGAPTPCPSTGCTGTPVP